jgi:polyphosphate kinase
MNKYHYRNKELSWLAFNSRVLQEAENPDVPLIERIKFLGIYSNNLDEFYRVRVATLKRFASLDKNIKSILEDEPDVILQQIYERVHELQEHFSIVFDSLLKELEQEKVFFIDENQLNPEQEEFVHNYFANEVRPKLFPVIMSKDTNFSHVKDDAIYLAIDLSRFDDPVKTAAALVKVPTDDLSRFLQLPGNDDNEYIILLDDIIRVGLPEIFEVLHYKVNGAYTIKITRDAELDIDDDVERSYIDKVSRGLKRRKSADPVRFVHDSQIPAELLKAVTKQLKHSKTDSITAGGRYHNFKDFMNFPDVGSAKLRFKKRVPIRHKELIKHQSILSVLAEKDILLHFPYQPFIHVIDLLREAALDPKVTTIKVTIYRVAFNSSIMNALINASRNGKQVTAVLELQARFNEESNIYWSQRLADAGVKVIYGVQGLKVHSKTILIRRKEERKIARYAAVGTGNFNEDTARIFSDIMVLTKRSEIANEVDRLFDFYNTNYQIPKFQNLLVSPFNSRSKINSFINREIRIAKSGKKAMMIIKVNNLVDHRMIQKIYEAHKAGVKIKLIVRGMFSLIPNIESQKIKIEAIGLIDRFLEHARCFYFFNGGEEKLYISSADLMERNLDRRVEVACPILDEDLKRQILTTLDLEWKDNVQARILDNELNNSYKKRGSEKPFKAQDAIYEMIKKLND